jgi:molybdopterin-guanine dinucleotide biosynthesis protein A
MGRDKGREVVDGTPLVSHIAGAITESVASVTVIAKTDGAYSDLGFATIADKTPDLGPLGGLETAMVDADTPGWVLLAACDWVGVQGEWVETLVQASVPGIHAVAFNDGRWQPLLALYHTDSLTTVRDHIKEGKRAMWQVIEAVPNARLSPPPGWESAGQINDQAALAKWRAGNR